MRRLILGGARSGKSSWGESLLHSHSQVTYVATARPFNSPQGADSTGSVGSTG
ncbi:MAG: bifunctional adenosylcobinamide kinase/adenosylcobinamide-phosphate guanylyltransferase, partial [Corynebacterium sp.]|nr:bifunctional adenosylcobinamide kinase/adenosylcobinamide-phosphate guanylyltransferase [Corynebacterium sp.]